MISHKIDGLAPIAHGEICDRFELIFRVLKVLLFFSFTGFCQIIVISPVVLIFRKHSITHSSSIFFNPMFVS